MMFNYTPKKSERRISGYVVRVAEDTISKRSRVLHKAYGAALYFTIAHCVHKPPRTPENPALHMQSVTLPLASAASEFEGQLRHASGVTALNVVE